jgi:uncharacterized protein
MGRTGEWAKHRVALATSVVLACLVAPSCVEVDPDAIPRTNLITGSTGSSWYTIGSAIAERTNLSFPGHPLTGVPGAGGVSNPARVARLGDDMGITHLPFLRAAHFGTPPYNQTYPELRHVATLIENKFHVLLSDRLGVSGFQGIVGGRMGVRIGAGPPGSGEEFLLGEVFRYYGITVDSLRAWGVRLDLLGTGQRADAWRDHHIDVIVFSINDPASVVTEMLHARDARIWELPGELLVQLQDDWGVRNTEIPGGTYPQHPDPIRTAGLQATIFAHQDVDERIVHAMARTIAESHDYLTTVHAGFRVWEVEEMMENAGVPRHPGASRYFRERGWLEP